MGDLGRPPKKFLQDRDRYPMALALAYQALGMSLRGACEAAVGSTEGLITGRNFNRGRGGHGMNLIDWKYDLRHKPGAAATIDGRARGVRQKLKKANRDPNVLRWLNLMRDAFLTALQTAAPDLVAADAEIMRLAGEAGESAYATDKIMKIARNTRFEANAAARRLLLGLG